MPVLPLERFVLPDDLFSLAPRLEEGRRWWGLHVKPRTEKALARRLCKLDVSFFLPLYDLGGRGGGRKVSERAKHSYIPLFPGYVFLFAEEECRIRALETNYVLRCLNVDDQQGLSADLASVHQLMLSGRPLVPEERIQPGTPVEIVAGPLTGMRGKLLRHAGTTRFVVEVNFLQRGASVEMEASMFSPL